MQLGHWGSDVAEVYSPPRVTAAAFHHGLMRGFALDLTVLKPNGQPWDFNIEENVREAEMLIDEEKPFVLIGARTCPPCTYGSKLQARKYPRVDPER
eukprot:13772487-Heterocapsa_arctica.AAC.1